MAPLKLPSYSALADPSPSIISKLCGFKREFLPEIATLIQSYSRSSILWRFDATLQLAEELNFATADEEEAITCALSEVLCWSRNGSPDGSPKLVQDELVDPFVCLIIDSRGIKSINRLSEHSATLAAQISIHPNLLIIEPVETVKSIDVEFRVCTVTCPLTLLYLPLFILTFFMFLAREESLTPSHGIKYQRLERANIHAQFSRH